MANRDAPQGFLPVEYDSAMQKTREYRVATTCTTAMAKGDLVDFQSDGTVARAAAGSTTITGVAMEFRWVDNFLIARKGSYLPAVNGLSYTDIWAKVIDDPRVRFVSQGTSDSVASQITDLGLCADHVDTPPSQVGEYQGHSNQEINNGTMSTSTASLQLEDRFPLEDNEFGSSTTNNLHGRYIVRIKEHFRNGVGAEDDGAPAAGV